MQYVVNSRKSGGKFDAQTLTSNPGNRPLEIDAVTQSNAQDVSHFRPELIHLTNKGAVLRKIENGSRSSILPSQNINWFVYFIAPDPTMLLGDMPVHPMNAPLLSKPLFCLLSFKRGGKPRQRA